MTQSLPQTTAAEVRAEMARQRVSQAALAEHLGRTQQYVSRRIVGEIPFDVADLEKIAQYLRVPISRFVRDDIAVTPADAA